MASPTRAEIEDQISKTINIFEKFEDFLGVTVTDNYIDLENLLVTALETDFGPEALGALSNFRAALSSSVEQAAAVVTPFLRTYGKFLDAAETGVQPIFNRLYDDFIDNSKTVKSRQFTFGSPVAAGGNSGNGLVHRLNTDANALDIENQTADSKIVTCTRDVNSGAVALHEELFRLRSSVAEKDRLKIVGSGSITDIKALSAADSNLFLSNPSFSQFDGTLTTPTDITDWIPLVAATFTNFALSEALTYRGFRGDVTPRAVIFKDNEELKQKFSVKLAAFNRNVPMYVQVAVNRNSTSVDGAFTLSFGGVTKAIADLTTIAASGWVLLRIDLNKDAWFENFNQQDPEFKIALTGRTTGDLHVDDITMGPYTFHDGGWVAIVGGNTPFLQDDEFTYADTEVGSVLQHWFWRAFGRYLPHTTGVATWLDPT